MQPDTPIFVGGLMKSGTSLLRKLLSNHSRIFGGLETHWFTPDYLEHFRDPSARRVAWLCQFFEIPPDEYAVIIEGARDGVDAFSHVMAHCTRRAGKTRWVEKTPDNVLHVGLIGSRWPDAVVFHVVRDLRDVYASWKRNNKSSIEGFIDQVQRIDDALTSAAREPAPQLAAICYEDLVTYPRLALEAVLSVLGERFENGLDEYAGDESDYQKVLAVTGKVSPTTESLAKPIFTTSIGQFHDVLDDAEARRIVDAVGAIGTRWRSTALPVGTAR